MTRIVRQHPDYPFSDGNLEATVLEMEGFLAEPPITAVERGEILEFVRLTRQYAFLERLIQGDILFELPLHLNLREATAEVFAEEERELLDLGAEPAATLIDALDERGIKVFFRRRGPEPPEILTGAFFYAGESGPSLLAGARGNREAVFIVAHAYGHLVMDVNPYRSRFCRWRRSDLENLSNADEERRADRFARALLLPESLILAFGRDLPDGKVAQDGGDGTILRLAEACEVPPAALWRRLQDLEHPSPTEVPPTPAIPKKPRVDERRATDLPERFVNLALAAFGHRLLDRSELARFLRIATERLDEFLKWCPIPRVRKGDQEEDEEVPPPETEVE